MSLYDNTAYREWKLGRINGDRDIEKSLTDLEIVLRELGRRLQFHRTGDDKNLVTGTAASIGRVAVWNTDGDLEGGDADADTFIQVEESADEDKIRFDTAGSDAMVIDENQNVGIGTEPSHDAHVKRTGAVVFCIETGTSATNASLQIKGPDQTWLIRNSTSDDLILVDQTGSTTPLSVVGGAPTNSFKIAGDGDVGFSEGSPDAQVHAHQDSASGAQPVLSLEQDDIDDSFINFIGTSAADGSRSISSDTTEDSAKFGAIRIEINGVTKWIRVYDDES